MKAILAGVVSIIALASCATPSSMYVGQDGKVVRCAAYGAGYVGAPMAQGIHDRCGSDARLAGLIPIEEAGGIGVQLSTEASSMRILKIGQGSPADRAGIKAGDSLVAIDDQSVTNTADARALAFGRVNTSVKVTYLPGILRRL